MRLPLVTQDVSKIALQWYCKCYCVAKTFTLKAIPQGVEHKQ
jgi:hypothetical protein